MIVEALREEAFHVSTIPCSDINIKAPQYNARYDKKKKNACRPLSAVGGYMVARLATPLLAMVEVAHHQLPQQ